MAKKKSEAPALPSVAPSLQDRLARLKRSVTTVTEGRWGLEDAALVPGQEPERFRRRVYSTGLLSLDQATELGGLPRGMIIELFGSPSAGKSLLLLGIIASVQRTCNRCYGPLPSADAACACGGSGGLFVLLDQEGSFDPAWAQAQGVDLDYLLVLKLPTGEQAVDILRAIMSQHKPDGIAIDSIAQLQPKTEQGKSAVDDAQQPGLHAKVMSLLCRHVTSEFLADPQGAPLFLWVNQLRADVSGHGALRVTGGMAPEFYSSFRLYMLKQGAVNQQHPEYGRHGRMTIKKCKMSRALEGRTVNYVLLPDGFDRATDTYETAVQSEVFLSSALQSGGHYWAEDSDRVEKLASSKQACIDRLKSDPAFHDDVRRRTLSLMGTRPVPLISLGDVDQGEGSEL